MMSARTRMVAGYSMSNTSDVGKIEHRFWKKLDALVGIALRDSCLWPAV
jgi:hypothetical protein